MKIDLQALVSLPTIPQVAIRLLEVLADPDVQIGKIANVIKTDPAITAKILKTVNSPLYCGISKIDNLDRAIVRLGKYNVSCLALSFSLVQTSSGKRNHENMIRDCWLESVTQAVAMEILAEQFAPEKKSQAFIVGLLADAGKLALLQHHTQLYIPVLEQSIADRQNLRKVEIEQLNCTHSQISSMLLKSWNLPRALVQAVEHHDESFRNIVTMSHLEDHQLVMMASTAAAASDFLLGHDPAGALHHLQSLTAQVFAYDAKRLDDYLQSIRDRLSNSVEQFSTDLSSIPAPSAILAMAMEQLLNMAFIAGREVECLDRNSDQMQKESVELQARIAVLERRTCFDDLTEIYNREYFNSRLSERLQVLDKNRCLGLVFVDIDHFKSINDNHGHLVGDVVLKQVASAIRAVAVNFKISNIQPVVARYGGEEFVVLVDHTSREEFEQFAKEIQVHVAQSPIAINGFTLNVTISVGGVFYRYDSRFRASQVQHELLDAADKAMYASKEAGGDRTHILEFGTPAEDGMSGAAEHAPILTFNLANAASEIGNFRT